MILKRTGGLALAMGLAFGTALVAAPNASALSGIRGCSYSNSEATVSYGAQGPVVSQIQCELNRAMAPWEFPSLTVDGHWGPATDQRVRKFQSCAGLSTVDGIVGPETWKWLNYWAVNDQYEPSHDC
ncbi:peptidoglycan-binding protein [Kitasatospora sp. NPDC127111]|uniref:peptidoglycan-binding domain-containing protein n=1 Tax=Kitasatospora sp. NPDC127111 TaxID=3345363 RepID=UPI00363811A3